MDAREWDDAGGRLQGARRLKVTAPRPEVTDAEIDAVLAEFGGDAREAIRALLHDVAALARGFEGQVSRGYVRGRRMLNSRK